MKSGIITLLIIVFVQSCYVYNSSTFVSFVNSDTSNVHQNPLRINGYYYFETEEPVSSLVNLTQKLEPKVDKVKRIDVFFLYNNGTVKRQFGVSAAIIGQDRSGAMAYVLVKNDYNSCHIHLAQIVKDRKKWIKSRGWPHTSSKYGHWGHYKINKDSIRIMYSYSVDLGFKFVEVKGKILNDSTLVLNEATPFYSTNYEHHKYKFRKSDIKPEPLDFMDYIN